MESFGVAPSEGELCALMQMLNTNNEFPGFSPELEQTIIQMGGLELSESCLATLLGPDLRGPWGPGTVQQTTTTTGVRPTPPCAATCLGAAVPGPFDANPTKQSSTGTGLAGPVRPPKAMDEATQGLIATGSLPDGSLQMQMTMLVSGFLIGPHGMSIRSIAVKTGAKISSFLMRKGMSVERAFVVEGSEDAISQAAEIMLKAVCRYKELTEGPYLGQFVECVQVVEGVEFLYYPPPKSRVPNAASVRSIPRI